MFATFFRACCRRLREPASALTAAVLLGGCAPHSPAISNGHRQAPPPQVTPLHTRPAAKDQPQASTVPAGVGPGTLASIPDESHQVLVVTGADRNSSTSTAALYERSATGWKQMAGPWAAQNALRGWTSDHRIGDLRSPVGTYTLTDAGGLLPNPGTRLPYHQSAGFRLTGTGFEGEPLAGAFDYVVAINYNRKPGTTPLDWTRPWGADKGGGIWVHVDHGGPTQACISISLTHMRQLLRTLDPALRPVITMGDAASLAR
ncbi:hypothetical protein F8R89_00420 [Streptomyces sp. SS1-1]|nr:hypothetical protein [Streptomyces sp. SS1-1]KAB2977568.1 hypothetical protein F8R89_00420 [Streptomyces sp. SS1-1]